MSPIYPKNALIMAPLSGFTDLPYRQALRRGGCKYAFTEMVDAAALTYARERTERMLVRGENESFLGVQIVGSNHEYIKRSIDILNEYDFDVLDFNLGCPVPKVAKKNAGATLGRNISEAINCFKLFKANSKHRISAKIRIISETELSPTLELCHGLAENGAEAITIHGRIKEAYYSGKVFFDIIREVKLSLPNVQIIANGGVTNKEKYDEIRQETTCTEVMIARGAMGNPWLFRELSDEKNSVHFKEYIELIDKHIEEVITYYGEELAMKLSRKILHDYLKGRGFRSNCKLLASQVKNINDYNILRNELCEQKNNFIEN